MSCPAQQRSSGDLRRRSFTGRSPIISAIAGGLCLIPAAAPAQLDLGLGTSPRPWFDIRNVFNEFRLEPSASTGITYTDNVDFEADAREDLIIFLRPRVNLVASARRLNTAIDYAFSAEYSTDEEGFRIEQISGSSLQSANTFEIVDNIFFVEANAGISREIIDNTITQNAGVESEQTDNFATVQRYLVRPIVRYQFDDFVVSETTTSVGYVDTGGDDDAAVTYSAGQSFASGPDFTTFQWSWNTQYVISRGGGEDDGGAGDEDDDDFEQFTTVVNGQLFVLPRYSIIGSVGFETIEDDSLEDEPDGVIWDVGFQAVPNPRLSLSATYGRRFDDDTFTFDTQYRIGPSVAFQARFDRTLQTQETAILNDLSFLGVNDDGDFIDTRTGLAPADDLELFGVEDETFTTSRLTANLNIERRRNSYSFNGIFEEREIEDVIEGDDTEIVYGAGAQWNRQLNRDLSGSVSLDYRFTEFAGDDEGREDDLITFRSSLSRSLGQGFSGGFNYVFRRQMSTFDEEDATENTVSLTLTKTF